METKKQETCADLVHEKLDDRLSDLRTLWDADDQETEELGRLCDYGLSIDLVEAGTFEDQRADYVRYQLSWGGPSDEFRVYKNGDIEYWYMDWYDGASVTLGHKATCLILQIVEPFIDGLDDFDVNPF